MSSGKKLCTTASIQDNVSSSVSGNTFLKSCKVDLVVATYPSFFHGNDQNIDGRVEIFGAFNGQPETASMSDATARTVPDVYYEPATNSLTPGPTYKHTTSINEPPTFENVNYTNAGELTVINYKMSVTSSNSELTTSPSDSGLGWGPCRFPPMTPPPSRCEVPKRLEEEWDEDTSNFLTPDPNRVNGRPIVEETTCPMYDEVPPRGACINAAAALTGWIFNIWGTILNLSCLVRNDCYRNVDIMVETDSMLGSNEGCKEPCGDFYSDQMISARSIPNSSGQCSNYGEGQDAPCFPDKYVGTPGLCTVCGQFVPCTIVWKNWLYDEYHRIRLETPPCIRENGDGYCTYEEYFEFFQKQV